MQRLALTLLLGAAAGLGLYLGWRLWQQRRNNPVHGAVHAILGVAGLECLLLMLRSAPDADGAAAAGWSQAAPLLLGLALMAGFAAPVVGRQLGRRAGSVALGVHAALALAGVLLALAWLAMA